MTKPSVMLSAPIIAPFLFLSTLSFGQKEQPDKIVLQMKGEYKPVTLELMKNRDQLTSMETLAGNFFFKGLESR